MTAADKIEEARKLIEPLTKLHDAATPGDLSTAETTDEGEWFDCPHCNGTAEVQADQFINYDGVAANVLFSGVGIEFGANRDWYLAVCRDWPKVRDTVAALADLADAQAQEIARLKGKLALYAIHEEYDCPGDTPEFCGWLCSICGEHVEENGSGHLNDCVIRDHNQHGTSTRSPEVAQ